MANRQFSTLKLTSGYIKQFKYKVELSYSSAKRFNKVINLADSQMLRTIREVTNHEIDYELLESWYKERDYLKNLPKSKINSRKTFDLQEKINDMMFIPEYITVVMDSKKQYERLFKKGFYVVINGVCRHYKRLSCSAGQARVSTVVFCDSEIIDEVRDRLDNGRDKSCPISPSKFNAYFGLYSSASKVVSTPNYCVIPDYENKCKVKVNYVTETSEDEDDIIDIREIELPFNRTDGMGLINYERSKLWAEELGLDYVPAEWCIRQSFIKGMLATFPIQEFCEKIGGGRYETTDVYGNKVDLRNIDIILTESQFKLWNAYPNLEYYNECCEKNNLKWGAAIHTPKKDNDILKLNYQFLQTLNLSDEDIDKVTQMFVDWIKGISFEDMDYLKLFLLGGRHDEKSIQNYMRSSDNYWIKCLILEPQLINDKFIRQKVYNLIKNRIQRGCLGEIIVNGNFQVIVSDPYAMMQHTLGMEVTGLLKEKEYYSNYWNEKGVKVVDSMRAPMTYLSEHVKLTLRDDEDVNYWYRYLTSGVILNYFGHETMNYAGSDKSMSPRLVINDEKNVVNL